MKKKKITNGRKYKHTEKTLAHFGGNKEAYRQHKLRRFGIGKKRFW